MTKIGNSLLAAVLISLAVPNVAGHASPTPLDNEIHILADEASDNFVLYDGFDIQDLFVREGYLRETGETGLIFRPIIYGGFGAVPVASAMNLDFSFMANGTSVDMRASSSDGTNWDGDFRVVEASMEGTEFGVGVQGSLQLFVSYEALGIQIGDAIDSIVVTSLADEDPRDISPGGYYAPGSGGAVSLPGEGQALESSYTLAGPLGYTESVVSKQNETYSIEVTNLITVIGQHVLLELPVAPGWTFENIETAPVSLDPGVHTTFVFKAVSDETADAITVAVTTDTGGREEFVIHPIHHEPDYVPEEVALEEESPGPMLLLPLLAALLISRKLRS